MTIYSVVDEGYNVEIYCTLKSVCNAHADSSLFIVPEGIYDEGIDEDAKQIPATVVALRKTLRKHGEVYISDDGGRDWKFKIVRHD